MCMELPTLKCEKWQTKDWEILEISFRIFSCPSFQFFPIAKIKNLDLKNL